MTDDQKALRISVKGWHRILHEGAEDVDVLGGGLCSIFVDLGCRGCPAESPSCRKLVGEWLLRCFFPVNRTACSREKEAVARQILNHLIDKLPEKEKNKWR